MSIIWHSWGQLIYFTESSYSDIVSGSTANYYDLHLENLSRITGSLTVLHLSRKLPNKEMQHPRLKNVTHAFHSESEAMTIRSLIKWCISPLLHRTPRTIVYVPYVSYCSIITWAWKLTSSIIMYQRITWFPFFNDIITKVRGKRIILHWITETAACRGADFLGAGSQRIAQYALRHGSHKSNIAITTNMVDSILIPRKTNYRLSEPPYLITVGRLVSLKRVEMIIRAVSELNICLDIYGEGCERDNLIFFAKEHGVNVRFKGNISNIDLVQQLMKADMYVSASMVEWVPKVILEAMAAALPVVACSATGVSEWLEDGRGLLTNADVNSLRRGIITLLEHEAMRRQLGTAAALYIRTHHSIDTALTQDRIHVMKALASAGYNE